MGSKFPGMRFSYRRLLVAIGIVLALVVGLALTLTYQIQALKPLRSPWTGGYVDVTETPAFEFESVSGSGQQNVVLSFIVASNGKCEPSWGNYYTLSEAESRMDLDRRISQIGRSGRTAVLSFGGRDNDSLQATCGDANDLAAAMGSALDHYSIDVVDLDIEGDDLTDSATRQKLASAVNSLQSERRSEGSDLVIWLTLPADRNGLTNDGVQTVADFLDAGADLSGVNLMTMNFGVPSIEETTSELSIEALKSAHSQLSRALLKTGRVLTSDQVWNTLGATPMIGQNDSPGEIFTIEDAIALHSFAQQHNLGRLSFWSLNRDRQCDSNYSNWSTAVNFCSGVPQDLLEFDAIFSSDREGSAYQPASDEERAQSGDNSEQLLPDDPTTSPYPIWSQNLTYLPGDKVVWKHNVYVSLWTSRDYPPDSVDEQGQTAWRLVGPVLPGESPKPLPTLPEGTYPTWDPDVVYEEGDRVMFESEPYESKWWNQGDNPALSAITDSSPWRKLTESELYQILGEEPEDAS